MNKIETDLALVTANWLKSLIQRKNLKYLYQFNDPDLTESVMEAWLLSSLAYYLDYRLKPELLPLVHVETDWDGLIRHRFIQFLRFEEPAKGAEEAVASFEADIVANTKPDAATLEAIAKKKKTDELLDRYDIAHGRFVGAWLDRYVAKHRLQPNLDQKVPARDAMMCRGICGSMLNTYMQAPQTGRPGFRETAVCNINGCLNGPKGEPVGEQMVNAFDEYLSWLDKNPGKMRKLHVEAGITPALLTEMAAMGLLA